MFHSVFHRFGTAFKDMKNEDFICSLQYNASSCKFWCYHCKCTKDLDNSSGPTGL